MAFRHVLKSIRDPKLAIKEMSIWDDSETRDNRLKGDITVQRNADSLNTNENTVGRNVPFIEIGEFAPTESGILEVVLDETEFIPTVKVVFMDERHGFKTTAFPKQNPILSLYIKATADMLKPIRNDYLISSIRQMESGEWVVHGELFIPKLYQNVSKSYGNMTSKAALDKVCEELGLGFQVNDFDTSDKMTWINPNWDAYSFIKYVINHAYQGDDSFFGGFIDKYYHLNMIDVDQQLDHGGDVDKTLYGGVDTQVQEGMKNSMPSDGDVINNMLLKYPGYNVGPNSIIGYDMLTDNGEILISDGYRKRIYYYDHLDNQSEPKNKMVDYYMRPILSGDAPGYTKDLEPENEDLKTGEIRKWMNIDYGNTHEQYNSSTLLNHHNHRELEKMTMKVAVSGINFNVAKGQRVPVGIFDIAAEAGAKRSQDSAKSKQNLNELSNDDSIVYDEFMSGTYYVKGTKYTFTDGAYSTQIYLARRDWKPVPGFKEEITSPFTNLAGAASSAANLI